MSNDSYSTKHITDLLKFQEYVQSKHGLHNLQRIAGGHTAAVLYKCIDKHATNWVVKVALRSDNDGVQDNIFGYKNLRKLASTKLVSKDLTFGRVGTYEYIVMPHFGDSISAMIRNNKRSSISDELYAYLTDVVIQSQQHSPRKQAKGIADYVQHIVFWLQTCSAKGLIEAKYVKAATALASSIKISPVATIQILDFTPDNVFIFNKSLAYIDPWRQKTYVGSFVPCIGQFFTLADEVYKLGIVTKQLQPSYHKMLATICDIMQLSEVAFSQQFQLGVLLQYLLSADVRATTDPTTAKLYAQKSTAILESLLNRKI